MHYLLHWHFAALEHYNLIKISFHVSQLHLLKKIVEFYSPIKIPQMVFI